MAKRSEGFQPLPRSRPRPQPIMDISKPSDFPMVGRTLTTYPTRHYAEPPATSTTEEPKKHRNWRKVIKRSLLVVFAVILLSGGWVGWKFYHNFSKAFGGNILDIFHTTKLKGEDTGRVNILLAGNSADDPGHNGANLTDSIMLISLDVKNNTAFMLSIPRDLWVNLGSNTCQSGGEYCKINEAYEDGGMQLLDQAVSERFGLPIDYYALINYAAFRDAVNAVGGITVNIQSCDSRGLYDPDRDYSTGGILVNLSNGEHTLNGQQALDLARARGDAYGSYGFCQSDFTRQQDQRLMLTALKSKALTADILSNPIKLGDLFDSIGNNVKTDLTLSDVRRLYQLGQKINNSKIKSVSLSYDQQNSLLQSSTYYGQDILIPAAGINDYSAIQAYVNTLTAVPTTSSH